MKNITDLKTVRLSDDQNAVVILDQTRLPAEECYLELTSAEDIWDAIYKLKVRGAPAIGVAAAYGIYVCSRQIEAGSFDEFYTAFRRVKEYLAGSRPTAVNLVAALNRMEKVVLENASETVPALVELLHKESLAIREEDAAACRRIGEHCLSLLRPGMGILTHCNAGHLAVSEYGTALAPVYLGEERGYDMETFKVGDRVYAEEDFIYGRIVEINGDVAHVEFRTSGGGGCLPYKLSELVHEKWCITTDN